MTYWEDGYGAEAEALESAALDADLLADELAELSEHGDDDDRGDG